MKLHHWSAEL
uniref:Uncharacterized protein n=1 Tax=Anguilla anguilla TaxID=7936 RepID=A0A0E9XW06_ANGAN